MTTTKEPRKILTLNGTKEKTTPRQNSMKELDIISPLVDKRVLIQLRNGATYTGLMSKFSDPWIVLNDAQIIGTKHVANIPEVFIRVSLKSIAHIHEDIAVTTAVGTGKVDQ